MKYYVIRTNKKGITFKKYKCIDGFSTNKDDCWKYSEQGAKRIADRLNSQTRDLSKVHYNILKAQD